MNFRLKINKCIIFFYFGIYIVHFAAANFNLDASYCSGQRCDFCGICLKDSGKSEYCDKQVFITDKFTNTLIIYTDECSTKDLCSTSSCAPMDTVSCLPNFGAFDCNCSANYYGQRCTFQDDTLPANDFAAGIHVMYSPQNEILEKTRFMVGFRKGRNLQVHVDLGLGFTIIQDEKSAILNNPGRICQSCTVTNFYHCRSIIQKSSEKIFMFEIAYPMSRIQDDMTLSHIDNVKYNYGRMYKIQVKVVNNLNLPNWEPIVFNQNFTRVIYHERKPGESCRPKLDVTFCSKDGKNVPIFFRENSRQIDSTVRSGNVECDFPGIKRQWEIWKNDINFDEANNRRLYSSFDEDEKFILISQFSWDIAKYVVKLSALMENTNFYYHNFQYCTFEIAEDELDVDMEGGPSKESNYKDPIILDASQSYDPNEIRDPEHQKHLRYRWSCQYENESICEEIVTKDPIRMIKGPFEDGKTYEFNLTVFSERDDRKPKSFVQKVELVEQTSFLSIKCWKNCGRRGFNSTIHEIVYLEVTTTDKDFNRKNSEFIWTYRKDNSQEQSVIDLRQPNTPSYILIVEPDVMSRSADYIFKVNGPDNRTGIYMIHTSSDPVKGNCAVTPLTGVMGVTNFTIDCHGFESIQKDRALTYEFYDNKPGESGLGILMDANSFGTLRRMYLVGGNITIHVYDTIRMYVVQNIQVNINNNTFEDRDIIFMLKRLDYRQEGGDKAGTMEVISIIAETAPYVKNKHDVMFKCINSINQFRNFDQNSLKVVASGLLNFLKLMLVEEENGLEPRTAQVTGYVMKALAISFVFVYTDISTQENEQETRSLKQIAGYLVEIAELISLCKNYYIGNKTVLSYDEENMVIQYREGAISMIEALQLATHTVGWYLMPYQTRFTIESTNFFFWSRMAIETSDLEKFTERSIELDEIQYSQDLSAEIDSKPGWLMSEVVHMKNNPFWWYRGCYNEVQSNVVAINIRKKTENTRYRFTHLKKPLDLYFNLTHTGHNSIFGTANKVSADSSPDEKNAEISVHRIETNIGAKLFIVFDNTTQPLKVLVLKNRLPEYDLMEQGSKIIDNENLQYGITDVIRNTDSFIYVGVVVDDSASVNEVAYSFKAITTNCMSWYDTILSRRSCEVVHDSTLDRLHCSCFHLSTFIGYKVSAQELQNLPADIEPLLEPKNNYTPTIAMILLLLFYLLFLLLAMCLDRKSEIKGQIVLLKDNYPGEEFGYLVAVYTGPRLGAGTDANVGLRLFGKIEKSRAHILRSSYRLTNQRNNDDWYLLFTPVHLGEIVHIHIWHDYSGKYADWFCKKIVIYDLEAKVSYIFPVDQWMSPGEKEYLEVFMDPMPREEVDTRPNLICENTNSGFRESHIWFSVINRHPRSMFTRAGRVAVCMCFIMLTLLVSIIYYYLIDYAEDEPYFALYLREIIVIIITIVIVGPLVYLILLLFQTYSFKKSNHAKGKQNKDGNPVDDNNITVEEDLEIKSTIVDLEYLDQQLKRTGKCNKFLEKVQKSVKTHTLHPLFMENFKPKEHYKENKTWMVIAWVVSQLVIILCAVLIILFGTRLGAIKTKLWLTSVGIIVSQDIFLYFPLKILIIAFVLGFVHKRLFRASTYIVNYEDAKHKELVGDKEYLYQLEKLRSQPMYHPLPRTDVRVLQAKRKRCRNWLLFFEYLIMLIFFILLITLTEKIYSARHFHNNDQIQKVLVYSSERGTSDFQDVKNLKDFKNYVSYTLFPKVYSIRWYNADLVNDYETSKFGHTGWLEDETHKLLGIPRIRQIRIKKIECVLPEIIVKANISVGCIPDLDENTEEKGSYKFFWYDFGPNPNQELEEREWVYTPANESESIQYYGKTAMRYDSGGYIADLARSYRETNYTLAELKYSNWLDWSTQFIIVEFQLYTVNCDLYSSVIFTVENIPGGIFIKTVQVQSLQIKRQFTYILFIIVFSLLTVFFLFTTIYTLNQQGFTVYFSQYWNYFEVLMLMTSIANLIFHVAHITLTSDSNQDYEIAGKDVFFSYLQLLFHYNILVALYFIIFLFLTIRLLKTYKFGRRYVSYYYTINFTARSMICITIVFILCLLLQSLLLSYRLNQPFLNTWGMFFMYKTGYKNLLGTSVYPNKRLVVFIYCLSTAVFAAIFIVFYSYYYRIARSYKLLRPEPLNFYTFFKEEFYRCKKPELRQSRIRGGMDTVKQDLHKEYEKLMMLKCKQFLKTHIRQIKGVCGDCLPPYLKNIQLKFCDKKSNRYFRF